MNSQQRRKAQRLYTKTFANDLILYRLLGGDPRLLNFYCRYDRRKHSLLLEHIRALGNPT